MADGRPMSREQFEQLPEEERHGLEAHRSGQRGAVPAPRTVTM